MESNLKCFFLKGKYRASDDFLVLILLISSFLLAFVFEERCKSGLYLGLTG